MKKEDFLVQWVFPYIGIGSIFALSFFVDDFSGYKNILFLWLLLLVLKDIFVYFVEIKDMKIKLLDSKLMEADNIGVFSQMLIWNRKRIFPVLLCFYIIQLLVYQTRIFDLHTYGIFQVFSDSLLLILIVISGIATIFQEEKEKKYEYEVKSKHYTIFAFVLIFILSLLWAYIILWQTARLGNLSFVISFISGILIFLVGSLVLEEDDDEEENRGR